MENAFGIELVTGHQSPQRTGPCVEPGVMPGIQTSESMMTEAQIKHMVGQFLGWKLPANFRPDGGISFEPTYRGVGGAEHKHEPVGTNLLDATQADAMVRHMLDNLPAA